MPFFQLVFDYLFESVLIRLISIAVHTSLLHLCTALQCLDFIYMFGIYFDPVHFAYSRLLDTLVAKSRCFSETKL